MLPLPGGVAFNQVLPPSTVRSTAPLALTAMPQPLFASWKSIRASAGEASHRQCGRDGCLLAVGMGVAVLVYGWLQKAGWPDRGNRGYRRHGGAWLGEQPSMVSASTRTGSKALRIKVFNRIRPKLIGLTRIESPVHLDLQNAGGNLNVYGCTLRLRFLFSDGPQAWFRGSRPSRWRRHPRFYRACDGCWRRW